MTFNFEAEFKRVTSAYLAAEGIAIPASIRKPTHGDCIHCGQDTDDSDEGEFLHEDCRDELIAEQRSEDRHNDPRRGQGDR